MIRVLIADDQALVRGGFRVLVESADDMEVVGVAHDGGEAVELARREHPDVVLMDVQMPGMDGLEATRAIVADPDLAEVRVLILTTFDLDEYIIETLDAGASGFLLKNTDPPQLLHGIRVVAGGEELLSPGLTRRLITQLAGSRGINPSGRLFDRLTEREKEVTSLVAQGLSNTEIAGRLFIGEATVKTHVSRTLMKVRARDRAHLVALVYQHGLGGSTLAT
ncbi:response regulator transcription factor [Nonomuraea sp. NPDC049784]|uniref:response regulator transcription factor n=1 Tax=Nonomuraea sp. NPDC049784 TaxID=3154361 RepID=UPI0033C0D5EF